MQPAFTGRRRAAERPIPFSLLQPPDVGRPWAHGDAYPRRGTLANVEAVSTSPGGQHETRFDPRDFRVERVWFEPRGHVGPEGSELLYDEHYGCHVWVRVLVSVISRAKAHDHADNSHGHSVYGPWLDRARPNL